MKVYIAGKISGDGGYKEKFARLEEELTAQGHVVLNPASLPEGMLPQDYMALCMQMLFACDKAVFMPDWSTSPGASLEYAMCRYIDKPTEMWEATP